MAGLEDCSVDTGIHLLRPPPTLPKPVCHTPTRITPDFPWAESMDIMDPRPSPSLPLWILLILSGGNTLGTI
jgi:hypothetical protein